MEALWLNPTVRFFHINTGSRRFIGNTSRKQEQIHLNECSTDMNNHADTHCFGSNIWPLLFTSEEFMVSPFLEDYSEQVNTPIFTGATSYTTKSGEFVILLFGQGLLFCNRMENILINPNYFQDFGILVCDEPTDHHRPLGIGADFNTHIPMSMVGSICTFITWYPTDYKI